MTPQPLVRGQQWSCLHCPFVASAVTDAGMAAAMHEHSEYVNRTKDRATDPHFAETRMEALLTDGC